MGYIDPSGHSIEGVLDVFWPTSIGIPQINIAGGPLTGVGIFSGLILHCEDINTIDEDALIKQYNEENKNSDEDVDNKGGSNANDLREKGEPYTNHSVDDSTHEFPHRHEWDWSQNKPRLDSR